MKVSYITELDLDQSEELLAKIGLEYGVYPPRVKAEIIGEVEYYDEYEGYSPYITQVLVNGVDIYKDMELSRYEHEDLQYGLINEYIQNTKE